MKKDNTNNITKLGILIAVTTLMTTVISIPIVGGNGYVNLGDMVILLTALLLNRKSAFIVGGVGSFLADIFLGYSLYAPASLIIKGLEGFIAGSLLQTKLFKNHPVFSTVVAGIWMAFGYYIFEIFLYGAKGAIASVPANIMQGMVGVLTANILFKALRASKVTKQD